jgi:hypothetical protein
MPDPKGGGHPQDFDINISNKPNIYFNKKLYIWIKANMVSVCGDKQGKAGQPGQPLRGAGRGAISIKKILGENRGTCI